MVHENINTLKTLEEKDSYDANSYKENENRTIEDKNSDAYNNKSYIQ